MKHHITLFSLIISAPCIAMEKQQPVPTFPTEITAIKTPRQAFFLSNNEAVINGESGCSIIDLKTNQEIKKISVDAWQHLVLNHNKTKVALYNTDAMKIFDTQTGNEEYTINYCKKITSAVFNKYNDILVTCANPKPNFGYAIIYINYKENKTILQKHFDPHSFFHNPTKNFLYSATSSNETKIYSHTNDLTKYECIKKINNSSCLFECSTNESLLAVANVNTLYLLDVNHNDDNCECFEEWNANFFHAMQFHPNSLYVAILTEDETNKNIQLRYHSNNAKRIANTPITIDQSKIIPIPEACENPPSLSFAPNGKHALVTMHNQCFSVPVPFEIVYQDGAKERTAFLYWLLKNYQINGNPVLPNEISHLITHIFLEACKR